jgi:hypothetical protein
MTESPDYLRDLAERLMGVPGVDQSDVDRLRRIAQQLERLQRANHETLVQANARLDDNLGDD